MSAGSYFRPPDGQLFYVFGGLTPGSITRLYVQACNALGCSSGRWISVSLPQQPVGSPNAPTVRAELVGSTRAAIRWTRASTGVTVNSWQISTDGVRWTDLSGGCFKRWIYC